MDFMRAQPFRLPTRLPTEPGLSGFWPFMEGCGSLIHDLSGKGNNGTLYGPVWASTIRGPAIWLDGTDDYALCPRSPSLDITEEITLVAWIRPEEMTADGDIIDKYTTATNLGYYLEFEAAFNKIELTHGDGEASDYLLSNTVLNWGRWYCVGASHSPGKDEIYINGELDNEKSTGVGLEVTDQDLLIGCSYPGSEHYHGTIKEVWVFNRRLLPWEHKRIYEVGRLSVRGW